MPSLTLCEREEETFELSELRDLVEEYDWLFERCMTEKLSTEELKTLDEIHGVLFLKEYEQWDGMSEQVIELIIANMDQDFPMIRYELGMLPDQY